MALSTLAIKIKAYLGIYKLGASKYSKRTTGYLDDYYNGSWVDGGVNSTPRRLPRGRRGLFKTGLQELLNAGY
jgi:hypothetical protein